MTYALYSYHFSYEIEYAEKQSSESNLNYEVNVNIVSLMFTCCDVVIFHRLLDKRLFP